MLASCNASATLDLVVVANNSSEVITQATIMPAYVFPLLFIFPLILGYYCSILIHSGETKNE